MMKVYLIVLSFVLLHVDVQAQFSLYFGKNISTVRTEYFDLTHRSGGQWGCHYRFKPLFKSRFYPHVQLEFSGQGYIQPFMGKKYENKVSYMHFTPGLTYRVFDYLTVSAGVDLSSLTSARQAVDGNVFRITANYQPSDTGLRGSVCLLDNRTVNIYLSYMRGLQYILHYEEIDPIGNFTGSMIKDIKNNCFQANVRFTFRSAARYEKK